MHVCRRRIQQLQVQQLIAKLSTAPTSRHQQWRPLYSIVVAQQQQQRQHFQPRFSSTSTTPSFPPSTVHASSDDTHDSKTSRHTCYSSVALRQQLTKLGCLHGHLPMQPSGIRVRFASTSSDDGAPSMKGKGMVEKIKELWRLYGYHALAIYTSLWIVPFATGWLLLANFDNFGLDPNQALVKFNIDYELKPWQTSAALAMFITDIMEPLRIGATILGAPLLKRLFTNATAAAAEKVETPSDATAQQGGSAGHDDATPSSILAGGKPTATDAGSGSGTGAASKSKRRNKKKRGR